jgi:hypothetical protein
MDIGSSVHKIFLQRFTNRLELITFRLESWTVHSQLVMVDILEQLGRRGAEICGHETINGQTCGACNVILFDSDETMKDATFAELLIASPRERCSLNSKDLDLRIRELREQLSSPMVYQKEYIEASIAKSKKSRSSVVTHKTNTRLGREKLFAKLPTGAPGRPQKQEETPNHESGIFNLTLSDSPSRMRMRVLLPPYGLASTPLIFDVDDSVSGRALIARIMSEEQLGLDSSRSYILRWVEDEDEMFPDLDLPPIDPDQPLPSINTNVLCLCDAEYDSDESDS